MTNRNSVSERRTPQHSDATWQGARGQTRGHDPGSIKVLGVQYFGHAEGGWQSEVGYTDHEGALDYWADA
jgi:hypothetical protein